jgi:hypothetical protein
VTLNTRIFVLGQVDHRELFAKFNQLIGADEGTRFSDDQDQAWHHFDGEPAGVGEFVTPPDGPWTIANDPEQGLCGWLMVHYRPGAPLVTDAQAAEHDEDCDDSEGDCTEWHDRACWLRISFDTAYSYTGPDGGCGDLHARLVAEFGKWLDDHGIPWQWQNEFTGEVFDRYDGLTELGKGGAEASDWFRNIVTPAIAAHMAGGAR